MVFCIHFSRYFCCFSGATLGPRPPYDYRDPNWDRGRGRGGPHPRPWGRGGPPDSK